jgi:hypothetical protein
MRIRSLPVVALLAAAAVAATLAPFTVVLKAGDEATDGLGVASVGPPVAGAQGEVFFSGTTAVILRAEGGTITTVQRCGDALPAPLTGTFGTFSQTVVNDAGAVAFVATLNSAAATGGLFLREGSTVTAVSVESASGTTGPGTGPFDLNGHGDIVARSAAAVWLWAHATGQTTQIGTAPTTARFTGQPVLGDGGHAAWIAIPRPRGGVGGVYTWDAASGVVPVVEEPGLTATTSSFRRANVAINAAGDVAYLVPAGSTSGAFVWERQTHTTRRVAGVGDVVGGAPLRGFARFIGIDGQGAVVFAGRVGGAVRLVRAAGGTLTALAEVTGASFPSRLPDTDRVVWIDDGEVRVFDGQVTSVLTRGDRTPAGSAIEPASPSVNAAGTVVFTGTHGALYRAAHGATTPVLQIGDSVAAAPTIQTFGAYAAAPAGLAAFATMSDGSHVLLQRTAKGVRVVAVDGTPTPGGGTFGLGDEALAVNDRHVAFRSTGDGGSAEGVFVTSGKRLQALAKQGDAAPGGGRFARFYLLAAGGDAVVFAATDDGGSTGLFVRQGKKTKRIVSVGDAIPDVPGHTFAWFGSVAAASGGVVFSAGVDGDTLPPGLYLWNRRKIVRLHIDATDTGPATDPFFLDGLAAGGRATFVAGHFGAQPFAIYQVGKTALHPVATDGDPSPTGGTIALTDPETGHALGYTVSPRGDTLTISTTITGGAAPAALIARAIPKPNR